MVAVRTVFRETPFEMPEDEAAILRAQGLVREDAPEAPKPDAKATPGGSAPADSKKES
jgi:hypothetical protein